MRRLLTLLVLALVVFIVVYRQRIFLWDPLAHVARDGERVPGTRVLINQSNDILLGDASAGSKRLYLVQHWNKVPETPTAPVHCLAEVACMTDADHATADPIAIGSADGPSRRGGVIMTDREIRFEDERGDLVDVTLR